MRGNRGYTLVEMLFIVGLLALLMGVAIPSIRRAVVAHRRDACWQNQAFINAAKERYAMEFRAADNYVPTANQIRGNLRFGTMPKCPSGGVYSIRAVKLSCRCSVHGEAPR